MELPLVDQNFVLEKFPGKGGWTYTTIPQLQMDKKTPFGWVKVKGLIDNFHLKNYNLMPMGNGSLFLPVKAEIRKKINKQAGDTVHVILYADHDPLEIPEELLLCLKDDPAAYETFISYSEGEQKGFIDWIYSAKRMETRVDRITKTLEKLARKEKFYSKLIAP